MREPEWSSEDVRRWREAAGDPAVAGALDALYAEVSGEIRARGPVCWASGRCCNFEKYGHRLYATGLETALTLARLPGLEAPAPLLPVFPSPPAVGVLTAGTLAGSVERGGCPFQAGNLCSVHEARPLGCRVYFCDRSAQTWQNELYEGAMGRLKAIHDEHGIPYLYGEWRGVLGMFLGEAEKRV